MGDDFSRMKIHGQDDGKGDEGVYDTIRGVSDTII